MQAVTVDELMALLEGYHCQAPVRVVVKLPGKAPVMVAITGHTGQQPSTGAPDAQDATEPGLVWLLTGEPSPVPTGFPTPPKR